MLVAAVQAVVVPVASPALLDAALVAALELLRLAQLGQHLSLSHWGKHPTGTSLYLLDTPRIQYCPYINADQFLFSLFGTFLCQLGPLEVIPPEAYSGTHIPVCG